MDLELVTDGLLFPEGPIAMADGSIVLVEIQGRRLSRVSPRGERTTIAELGGGPNGAAIGPDGAAYITNNGGMGFITRPDGLNSPHGVPDDYDGGFIQRVDLASGAATTLYTACDGQRLKGPNDIVFAAD